MFTTINVALFLLLQVGTALSFQWGGRTPEYYWWGFLIGNVFGLFSTLTYINVFKTLHGNLAVAVCAGGAFLTVQIVMAVLARHSFNHWMALGAFLVFGGILLMSFGAAKSEAKLAQPEIIGQEAGESELL